MSIWDEMQKVIKAAFVGRWLLKVISLDLSSCPWLKVMNWKVILLINVFETKRLRMIFVFQTKFWQDTKDLIISAQGNWPLVTWRDYPHLTLRSCHTGEPTFIMVKAWLYHLDKIAVGNSPHLFTSYTTLSKWKWSTLIV